MPDFAERATEEDAIRAFYTVFNKLSPIFTSELVLHLRTCLFVSLKNLGYSSSKAFQ